MSSHQDAIDKLKAARDALVARITERVNDCEDFVDSFTNDFSTGDDAIMELGERLYRINQVINTMPFQAPGEPPPDLGFQPVEQAMTDFVFMQPFPTWDDYLWQVDAEKYEAAATLLAELCGIDWAVARKATEIYAGQLAINGCEVQGMAKSLRAQIRASRTGTLHLIQELFGITGPTAARMYDALRTTV